MNKRLIVLCAVFIMCSEYAMEVGSQNKTQVSFEENDKKIKQCILRNFRTSWEDTKETITKTVLHGVSTPDVQEYDNSGYTPLCLALDNNDIEFTKFLLQHDANVNFDLRSIHSSKPIFFAKSVEMAKLLKSAGANFRAINTGSGVRAGGRNLLHASINCNTPNTELFKYYLSEGLDPYEKTEREENLWHSLIYVSVSSCPEELFVERAKLLFELKISPYDKNVNAESAIDIVERRINEGTQYLNNPPIDPLHSQYEFQMKASKEICEKLTKFIKIMKKEITI